MYEAPDAPDRGQETAARVFAVDARLDGVALLANRGLLERQPLARCDAQLPLDEIEAGDQFGDRMLDLQARVHLHEIEAPVGADDELDGAGVHVADRLRGAHGRGRHRGAGCRVDEGRRRFLDDLLVAALHRAFALEQVHATAMRVAEDLYLDVARPLEEALEHEPAVAECAFRLAARAADRLVERGGFAHDAHALATAAGHGLDEERISDGRSLPCESRGRLILAHVAGHDRHARGGNQRLGLVLQAHRPHRGRRRTDEDDACGGAGFGEGRVLGKETVARVDRIGARVARGLDDRCGVEVGLPGGRRPDGARFVGEPHVQRSAIGLRVHGDRVHAEPAAGPDHAAGDLAAIGDQEPPDLHSSRIQPGLRRSRNAVSPSRASAPARTRAIQRVVSMIMDSSVAELRPVTRCNSRLISACAFGPPARSAVTIACVASGSAASSTASCTSPIRIAVDASMASPVRHHRWDSRCPMARIT